MYAAAVEAESKAVLAFSLYAVFKGDMLANCFFQLLKLYLMWATTMLSAVILGGISLSAPQSPKYSAMPCNS